jgi:hypothetical protein
MSLHDENSAGTTGPVTGTMTMTHSHSVVTHASSASKVLSTPYTPESFQKTFNEFDHLIQQRRAELSEMKRYHQLRLNNKQQDDQESPPAPAPSVIMGMEVQLREEISRTQKLNEKIEELHQLEEVQRNKAHMLAMEKDK